jgi:hypothetical protein
MKFLSTKLISPSFFSSFIHTPQKYFTFYRGVFCHSWFICFICILKNRGFFLSCLVTYLYTCGILLTEHWMPEREDLVCKFFCHYR